MTYDSELTQAYRLYDEGRYGEAFLKYKLLAEQGSIECQQFVAWMYQEGVGTNKDDEKAFAWYRQAAELGSAVAQFHLAKRHQKNKNYPEAIEWYRRSAKKEYSPALYRLGWLYERGLGLQPDMVKAIYYYRQASKFGHAFALRNLGRLLIKGEEGFLKRFMGFYLVAKAFFTGIKIGMNDPFNDQVRE